MPQMYGAKAAIRIRFESDMKTLASKLSTGLSIHEFRLEPREDAPYDIVGSNEALGFEMWLEEKNDSSGQFRFSLTLSSQDTFLETAQGRMHDLSVWFAKITSLLCRIDCLVPGTSAIFQNGKEGIPN